ncbi:MAG TPA: hypothetical protein ENG63_09695 [Candidatus Desulfofervidus auxilii]|uniref:Uncharacterized protein n=1 Tax=Desulfofervidus auxilii TaxID=1621989 RepID=A0A7C0U476_DESA2|nr:hypothetical protein [Candidatus Desulfofervidus auxilii]
MCEFFSFAVKKDGAILALLGAERTRYLAEGKNPDSHSLICEHFGVNEDDTWKFEIEMTKNDIERLTQAPLTVQTIEELEKHYDGGIDFKEFPTDFLPRIQFWLEQNKDKIIEAGNLKYGADLVETIIGKIPAQFEVILAYPRLGSQIFSELTVDFVPVKNKTDWYKKDDIRLIIKLERENTYSRLFVSRYIHEYARVIDGTAQKFEEYRIVVYGITKTRKEGEMI